MQPPLQLHLPGGQVRSAVPATDYERHCTFYEHDLQTGERFAKFAAASGHGTSQLMAFLVFRRQTNVNIRTHEPVHAPAEIWKTCCQAAYTWRVVILSLVCAVLCVLCIVFITLYATER